MGNREAAGRAVDQPAVMYAKEVRLRPKCGRFTGSILHCLLGLLAVSAAEGPRLGFSVGDRGLRLHWPTNTGAVRLESSDSPVGPVWTEVPSASIGEDGRWFADSDEIVPGSPLRFFRLRGLGGPPGPGPFRIDAASRQAGSGNGFSVAFPLPDSAVSLRLRRQGGSDALIPVDVFPDPSSARLDFSTSDLVIGTNRFEVAFLGGDGQEGPTDVFELVVLPAADDSGPVPSLTAMGPATIRMGRPRLDGVLRPVEAEVQVDGPVGSVAGFRLRVTGPGTPTRNRDLGTTLLEPPEVRTLSLLEVGATTPLGLHEVKLQLIRSQGGTVDGPTFLIEVTEESLAQGPVPSLTIVEWPQPIGTGGTLRIVGMNLGNSTNPPAVFLGEDRLEAAFASDGRLEARIPARSAGGMLTVHTEGGTAVWPEPAPVVQELRIRPAVATLRAGERQVLKAVTPDGTAVAAEWSLEPAGIATLGADGLLEVPVDLPGTRNLRVIARLRPVDRPILEAALEVRLEPGIRAMDRLVAKPGLAAVLISGESYGTRLILGTRSVDTEREIGLQPLAPEDLERGADVLPLLGGAVLGVRRDTLGPDTFLELPLRVRLEPGRRIRVYVGDETGQGWVAGDLSAVVTDDGIHARVELSPSRAGTGGTTSRPAKAAVAGATRVAVGFERVDLPPVLSAATVNRFEPGSLREGELRPFYLESANLLPEAVFDVVEPAPSTATTRLVVVERLFRAPGSQAAGVLVRSHPDTSLPAGRSREWRLRIRQAGFVTYVPFQVEGLDELDVPAGTTRTIGTPGGRFEGLFSAVDVRSGATLRVLSRVLEVQATSRIRLTGDIDARGADGAHAVGSNGGAAGVSGGSGGQGHPRRGSPSSTLVTETHRHGETRAVNRGGSASPRIVWTYPSRGATRHFVGGPGFGGDPGRGIPGADSALGWSPSRLGDNVYRWFREELEDELPSGGFDRIEWIEDDGPSEVARDFLSRHPDGRKGQAAASAEETLDAGLTAGPASGAGIGSGRHANLRVWDGPTLAGNGGGGGGGSGNVQALLAGGGGGAGGDGGAGLRLVSGGLLELVGTLDTSGGRGGNGARMPGWPYRAPGPTGGGGGPGSPGNVRLLAGERIRTFGEWYNPNPVDSALGYSGAGRIRSEWGTYGDGGFRIVEDHERRAPTSIWPRPAYDVANALQTGARPANWVLPPHFQLAASPEEERLATSVRLFRTLQVRGFPERQTPLEPGGTGNPESLRPRVVVESLSGGGTREFPIRGPVDAAPDQLVSRLLLFPGFNRIRVGSNPADAVLATVILVLSGDDSDGDGIPDIEESRIGTDPGRADTDGDGTSDSEAWLNPPSTGSAAGGSPTFAVGRAPLRGVRPALDAGTGNPPGTVVSRPPARVTRPSGGR